MDRFALGAHLEPTTLDQLIDSKKIEMDFQ